jgi:hypothetical protein
MLRVGATGTNNNNNNNVRPSLQKGISRVFRLNVFSSSLLCYCHTILEFVEIVICFIS